MADLKRILEQKIAKSIQSVFEMQTSDAFENILNRLQLGPPKDERFGDYMTNVAFILAPILKRAPIEIAQRIVEALSQQLPEIADITVAGKGFINMTMNWSYWHRYIEEIIQGEVVEPYITNDHPLQIEFVSANPTGPLNVVNARAAALGDSLARICERKSLVVEKEYYVNDAGKQTEKLAISLQARIKQLLGEDCHVPDDGYPGEYVIDIAKEFLSQYESPERADIEDLEKLRAFAIERIQAQQKRHLEEFGVVYNTWFSEKKLYLNDQITHTLQQLKDNDAVYEKDDALWLRTSEYGDEKDRVLVKSDGESTYFLADITYHLNKIKRGFRHLINIWGPDHHGHIVRMKAALQCLGYDSDILEIIIAQQVNLMRQGKKVKMTKRGGTFIQMSDLLAEVGRDAARFFFIMRKPDSHLDFDLDLAVQQSRENPVYYIQYATARIASIFRQAEQRSYSLEGGATDLTPVSTVQERRLIKLLSNYSTVLDDCIRAREPHRLAFYLLEIAGSYHKFQHDIKVLVEDDTNRNARLTLIKAVRKILAEGLDLLGISAPEKM